MPRSMPMPRPARSDFVFEHVGHAFEEDERQDVALELGRVHRRADDTSGFPKTGFETGEIKFHTRIRDRT